MTKGLLALFLLTMIVYIIINFFLVRAIRLKAESSTAEQLFITNENVRLVDGRYIKRLEQVNSNCLIIYNMPPTSVLTSNKDCVTLAGLIEGNRKHVYYNYSVRNKDKNLAMRPLRFLVKGE